MICIIQNSVLGVQNYDTFIMLRKKNQQKQEGMRVTAIKKNI